MKTIVTVDKVEKSHKWLKLIVIAVILFLSLSVYYSTFVLGIAAKWLIALIPFSGVGIIFYSFAGIFTQKKLYKYLITALLVCFCYYIYYEINKPPKVVHMQEDVLYIKPKAHR
jgi:hypothetical protein